MHQEDASHSRASDYFAEKQLKFVRNITCKYIIMKYAQNVKVNDHLMTGKLFFFYLYILP